MWEKTYDVLMAFGAVLKQEYVDNLIKSDRFTMDKGLIQSVNVSVTKGNKEITVWLSLADYWKYVEFDTRPHFPPPDRIKEWIKAKPVEKLPDGKGRIPTDNQLAFLIGRAMAGKSPNQARLRNPQGGTKGTHDLEDALERVLDEFEDRIMQAVADDLVQDFDAIFRSYFPERLV